MPLSWVDISNMAVARIGVSTRVVSLDATDKVSLACNTAIFPCRDAVLEGWDWKCVSVRSPALTKDATSPSFGFANRYLLPSKPYCLVVREFRPSNYDYVIEGRYLLTDADSDTDDIFIRYTSSTDDPSVLTTLCAKAIAWRMASEICNQLVQGNANTGQAQIMKEYMAIIEEAQGANQWQDKDHNEDGPSVTSSTSDKDSWVKAGTGYTTW